MMSTSNLGSIALAFVLATSALASVAVADPDPDQDADADLVALSPIHGPPIADVLSAAYAAAGLDRLNTRGLVKRARYGGLVPWLTVRTGRNASWQSDDPTVDKGMVFEVRATWRLDRLVFDGRELQIETIEAARRRERRRLGRVVIRAYFTWQRAFARVASHLATRSHVIATDEAAAELDALTDGWFSEALAHPRRTASENRTPRPD